MKNPPNEQTKTSSAGKLELIATQKFTGHEEMYKIIDFLNRNLKEYKLLFGLTKNENTMTISVYEVE